MKKILSTVMAITVMALSSLFAQEKIKRSDLDWKNSATISKKFPINNLQSNFFKAEETFLLPGAFNMPCINEGEYQLDVPFFDIEIGVPILLTGNMADNIYGQVFKESFESRQVVEIQAYLINIEEGDGDIYAYIYDLDENDMPSKPLGKSEVIRVSDIKADGGVYLKTFTFATPVEVTGNFAAVIELPEFDFFETIVAVATSVMGCYSNKNYAVSYTIGDDDEKLVWIPLGESWNLDDPSATEEGLDFFEMAIFVKVTDEDNPVSLSPQNEYTYSIYPNPATDVIYVDNAPESTVRIIDTTGKVIIERSIPNSKERIEIRHLEKGIYFIEISGKDNKHTSKLIKK